MRERFLFEGPARWIGIALLALGLVFVRAGSSWAHKVIVFAWVEGDTVRTESKYSGGRKVKEGQIIVYDMQGQKVLEGKTDDQGLFSFKAPKRTDLKIVLNAGMGHRAEWTIKAQEFGESREMQAPAGPKQRAPSEKGGTAPSVQNAEPMASPREVDTQEIRRIVERALDEKLAPVIRRLQEMQDRGPSPTEVLGGIGYILGLIGIAAYFSSRQKR
jgi:nickel transport protein